MNLRTHRLIRQLHLWIGAWGAIAAILFGSSGFIQNHRGSMKLPQGGSTEISSAKLDVPESARASRESMLTWLRDVQHLDVGSQRSTPGRWLFNGGNARIVTQIEYNEGGVIATVRKSQNSPLAVLERLHKGVGGGVAWIVLSDSFALAMVTLGISGLILWARGRGARQMVYSIVGAGMVVLLVIGGSAII